jgi:hypothetical protein
MLNRVMVAEVAELLAHYELISNASDVSFHVSLISDLLPHRLFGCFARGDVENQPCSTSKLLPSALVCGVPVTMIPDRAGGCCCIARLAGGIPPTLTANRPRPSYLPDTAECPAMQCSNLNSVPWRDLKGSCRPALCASSVLQAKRALYSTHLTNHHVFHRKTVHCRRASTWSDFYLFQDWRPCGLGP